MVVQLLPEMIGLMITPLAIAGTILLLQTKRPLANAVFFGTAFVLLYTVLSIFALVGGKQAPDDGDTHTAGVLSVITAVVFLLAGAVMLIRRPKPRTDAPAWVRALEECTPVKAFLVGLGAAFLNPNVIILLAGLSIVVNTAGSTGERILGMLLLVGSSMLDFVIPIALFVAFRKRATSGLETAKRWTVAHTRVITIAMFFGLGLLFLVRGIGKL